MLSGAELFMVCHYIKQQIFLCLWDLCACNSLLSALVLWPSWKLISTLCHVWLLYSDWRWAHHILRPCGYDTFCGHCKIFKFLWKNGKFKNSEVTTAINPACLSFHRIFWPCWYCFFFFFLLLLSLLLQRQVLFSSSLEREVFCPGSDSSTVSSHPRNAWCWKLHLLPSALNRGKLELTRTEAHWVSQLARSNRRLLTCAVSPYTE